MKMQDKQRTIDESNELIQYLYNSTTEERANEIKRSLELMFTVRGSELEDGVNNLFQNVAASETPDPVRDIEIAVFDWVYQTLRQYGVVINEDIVENGDLVILNDLLFSLQAFDYYEDVDTLYHTSELQGTIKETFVNLIEIISGRDSNQFLELLTDVSSQLLLNIKDILTTRYREEQRRLEIEAKEHKKNNTEAIRKKREVLHNYIEFLSNGNEDNAAWFKKFISKMITYSTDEVLVKIQQLVQTKKYTVNQQVGLWCIGVHLLNFMDATKEMENPVNRYQQCKEIIAQSYTDANLLFTISHRVDEVINGS